VEGSPAGRQHRLEIEKDANDGLGLGLNRALFDGLRQCNTIAPLLNRPSNRRGKRRSFVTSRRRLNRLSFLLRLSYLTLTISMLRLAAKIEESGLSPLGLFSVQANGPGAAQFPPAGQSRRPCCSTSLGWFGRTAPGDPCLRWWVCPGLNDGEALLGAAAGIWAGFAAEALARPVLRAAVVPVG